MRTTRYALRSALPLVLALAGCSSGATGSDASPDSATDSAPDSAPDSTIDVAQDTAPEAALDAAPEASPDTAAPDTAAPDTAAPDALDAAAPDVPAVDVTPPEAAVVVVTDPCDPRAEDPLAEGFARGRGTATDPYVLCTREHLARLSERCNALAPAECTLHARLARDLDLSGAATMVRPIKRFNASFDGQGHRIANFAVDVPPTVTDAAQRTELGLFGTIGAAGVVRRLRLENVFVRGFARLGGLAGVNNGLLADCEVSGRIEDTGSGNADPNAGIAGGLAGISAGTVLRSRSSATVSVGTNQLGGLVGLVERGGAVVSSQFTGTLELRAGTSTAIGGITAQLRGTIANCTTSGTINAASPGVFGGLVGNLGFIGGSEPAFVRDSSTTLRINANAGGIVGGLVGYMRGTTSTILDSSASQLISVRGWAERSEQIWGGLVGTLSDGFIVRSGSAGELTGASTGERLGNLNVGGLVGRFFHARVRDCSSRTSISVPVPMLPRGDTNDVNRRGVGGLVGFLIIGNPSPAAEPPVLENSYAANPALVAPPDVPRGGVVGFVTEPMQGAVHQTYWDQQLSGATSSAGTTLGTAAMGLTTAQLQTATPFPGWDGVSTWQFTAGSYPTLR